MGMINYSINKNPRKEGDDQEYHVRAVTAGGNMSHEELREYLVRNTGLQAAHFEETITALAERLPSLLLQNCSISIKGIGRMSLKLGLKKKRDSDGRLVPYHFTDPKAITAHYIEVKGVNITPDVKFKNAVRTAEASFTESNVVGRSDTVTRAQLLLAINQLFKEHPFITYKTLREKLDITVYKARKLLNNLAAEEYPKIYREKLGTQYVYLKTGDNI